MKVKLINIPADAANFVHGGVEENELKDCESKPSTFEIEVARSSTVGDVKKKLEDLTGICKSLLKVFFRGKEVKESWHLYTSMSENECLVFTHSKCTSAELIRVCGLESLASLSSTSQKILQNLLHQARAGFLAGIEPELSEDGSGGTYFLKNKMGVRVACFKPRDEEPSAENNPRGLSGKAGQVGLRDGVLAGEAIEREVSAFITDVGGFSSVPETIMVETQHHKFHYSDGVILPKVGSLQRYVVADCIASDFSPQLFPVDEVHKIAILDIRLLNGDRNDANMLVVRRPKLDYTVEPGLSTLDKAPRRKVRSCSYATSPKDFDYELIPIDHGYCLPDRLEVTWYDWCWLDWPQTREPFSEKSKEWIRRYDIDACVEKLRRELNIREPCLRMVRISGIVLKKAVSAGLCLHDIASIIVREDKDVPSVLEDQIRRATDLASLMLRNSRVRGSSHAESEEQHSSDESAVSDSDSVSCVSQQPRRSRYATLSSASLPNCSERVDGRVPLTPSPLMRVNSESHVSLGGFMSKPTSAKVNRRKSWSSQLNFSDRINDENDPSVDTATSTHERHIQGLNVEFTAKEEEEVYSDKFLQFFFEYLERLVDDVIVCLQQHRQRDKSMLRRTSSLRLTSPHRKFVSASSTSESSPVSSTGDRRSRCDSSPSFFSESEKPFMEKVPLPSDTLITDEGKLSIDVLVVESPCPDLNLPHKIASRSKKINVNLSSKEHISTDAKPPLLPSRPRTKSKPGFQRDLPRLSSAR
mmetsp:Transcript_10756/g.17627  ORF Transcript_10756/g.17627 Transcript_10756/m.17627 type:complete len:757 (+) Transcript_10756:259-2529(+)|eukprot:CAMPEP_0203759498 /NCGR_PEP_ID=MMETSP0098-20131031/12553_1 /ASSEMBLY_ACC=CAM_ASM_000208 /TAXON_ID=96639 /ORGANISM=" , Strain NY0313808BC1" /LENGTH=756 /DNA_ID=CAMNT_0050652507 /DNA_START=861 /DNA_END=3131 /DNA_ORIENTATION=-